MTKLNLGCGLNAIDGDGWINVDAYDGPAVDVIWDLEVVPWRLAGEGANLGKCKILPLGDGEVDEVALIHTLEHIGQASARFISFMIELYRVSAPGAIIRIHVPHPRHDDFLGDPTHVRPVTPQMLELFSKKANLAWQAGGFANTPLALRHDVDFELQHVEYILDERFSAHERNAALDYQFAHGFNVCREIRMTLIVIK